MKLSDSIVSKLLDMITIQKVYRPGDKLPNEKELAASMHVSRTTVREAIQYLVSQNILEVRRGKGTFVVSKSEVEENFGFDRLKVMHLKIKDLYEMRLMLEPQMCYYAAMRATDAELEEIMQLGKQIENISKETDEASEENRLFHNAIAKATHNEFGIKLMEILNEALIKAFAECSLKQSLYGDVLLDHKMIMNYLAMRDAEGAKQAMYLHINHAVKDYLPNE